jgi:streptogramin lyase
MILIRRFSTGASQFGAALSCLCSLVAAGTPACGTDAGNNVTRTNEATGVAEIDITAAPPDARCLQVTIVSGASTVTRQVPLVPAATTAVKLTGLPTGPVTLSAQAFTAACTALQGQTPKWASDAITTTLPSGAPVSVTFELHLAVDGGVLSAAVDFPSNQSPVTEFPLPTPPAPAIAALPAAIALGPDGNIWVADTQGRTIVVVDTSGAVVRSIGGLGEAPFGMVGGPDGNMWAVFSNIVARVPVSPGAAIAQFTLPAPFSAALQAIAVGADGNLWFVEDSSNRIGRITTTGQITGSFPIPTANSNTTSIAPGPDGNLWFAEDVGNKIGRVTTLGVITEFNVPTASAQPFTVTAGPDGNLWFTEAQANKIGRITPAGAVTEFPLASGTAPIGITTGSDGNLWFGVGGAVGRITPAGVIKLFPTPTATSFLEFDVLGPDGNIWVSETQPGNVARLNVAATIGN